MIYRDTIPRVGFALIPSHLSHEEKGVILRKCRHIQPIQDGKQLGAVVGAMIDHMQQHLPQTHGIIFAQKRLVEQHIIGQGGEIIAHGRFDTIPLVTDDAFAIAFKLSGVQYDNYNVYNFSSC